MAAPVKGPAINFINLTAMKNIIAHPLVQLLSFLIILVNGIEWSAMPYGWFVLFGTADGKVFAIIGMFAILICLASIFWRRNFLQPVSLLVMWCSLFAFYWQLTNSHKQMVFKGGPGLITVLVFLTATIMVLNARMQWKNS